MKNNNQLISIICSMIIFSVKVAFAQTYFYQVSNLPDYSYTHCNDGQSLPYIYGTDVFHNYSSLQVNPLTLSGWFFFRGYNPYVYNIFTIYQSGSLAMKVGYQTAASSKIESVLSTNTPISDSLAIQNNQWYFIYSTLSYASGSVSLITNINTINSGTTLTTTTQSTATIFLPLSFAFNFGNFVSDLSVRAGCSFIRNIKIYWGASIGTINNYYNDFFQLNTQLIWNIDFFYYQANNGYLQNTVNSMDKLQILINSPGSFQVTANKFFLTDFINIVEQSGFTLSFHLKPVNSAFTNNIRIMVIQQLVTLVNLDLVPSGKIALNLNYVTGISFNQWNQVTILGKVNGSLQVFLIVKGFESQIQQVTISMATQSELPQIQFGHSSNSESFLLSNLRIYKGALLTQTNGNGCALQTYEQQCLFCNSGQLLDYQYQMQCVTPSAIASSTLVDNVKDWFPSPQQACPPDMVVDQIEQICKCRYQYFFSQTSNICLKCPDYCKGCYDQNNCIVQDPLRDSNGDCPQGTFDDGYSCLSNKMIYGSTYSYQQQDPKYNQGDTCIQSIRNPTSYEIDNTVLRLADSNTFFFSFTYKSQLPSYQRGSIWYLQDGPNEIFTIMYNQTLYARVQFFQGGVFKHEFLVNNNQPVWIAIWTDLQTAIYMVNTNSQFLYFQSQVNISWKYNNPYVCIGPCFSQFDDNYYCGDSSQYPQLYIYNLLNPINDIMEVQNFFFLTTTLLANFQVDMNDSSLSSSPFLDSASGLTLDFQSTSYSLDKVVGFHFTQSTSAVINSVIINNALPTFSTYLQITILQYQTSLIQYNPNSSTKIEYFLVPFGSAKVVIRICIFTAALDCKDSAYSMINMQENNLLMIIPRLRSIFESAITYYEFEVVCNYQRQLIPFIFPYQTFDVGPININIASKTSPSGSLDISMNNLSLYSGNGSYYFDYSDNSNCFISINVTNMSCIVPKEGKVLYKGQAITEDQCKNNSKYFNKLFYVNSFTRECVSLDLDPTCQFPYFPTNPTSCFSCQFSNALVSQNCMCPGGYYGDTKQMLCIQCSNQCLTCTGSADNCLTCASSYQLPPKCNCILDNMYRDVNGICQYCSSQCLTCQDDPNNCVTCVQSRINPPGCECDPVHYVLQNSICVNFACDLNCLTCSTTPSNCQLCKSGRINPPDCICDRNYIAQSDGTCALCPSGQFLNSSINLCQQCSQPCLQCINSPSQCTACEQGLILDNSSCKCDHDGLSVAFINGKNYCLPSMNVSLSVVFQQTFYQLVFNFDYTLKSIDFSLNQLNDLLQLTLTNVPASQFSLINPQIKGNQLITQLKMQSNVQCKSGQVLFLQNALFISNSGQQVLDISYKVTPLLFDIGPFLFTDDVTNSKQVTALLSALKNGNQQVISTIQQTQFVFYLLNTAQPTLLFLLLEANFPPNLYNFYQSLGMIVFPDVVDYQTTNYKTQFKFFGIPLNQSEVYLHKDTIFKRVGMSNSFFINAQTIILKYVIIFLLILLLYTLIICNPTKKPMVIKLKKIKDFLIQRINSENEINLLLLSVSIFIQFTYDDQSLWDIRLGYYFGLLFVILFILSFYWNIDSINKQTKFIHEHLEYSEMFTERTRESHSKLTKNYFLSQILKKYSVVLIVFFMRGSPYPLCIIVGVIFSMSSFYTVSLMPYKHLLSNIIKIIGDLILSVCWFIHFFILRIEQNLFSQANLEEEKITQYINIGYLVMLLLFIFNCIFLIEYLQSIYFLVKGTNSQKEDQSNVDVKLQDFATNFISARKSINDGYEFVDQYAKKIQKQKNFRPSITDNQL